MGIWTCTGMELYESMDPTYEQAPVLVGGASVLVWGVSSLRESLILRETTVTGRGYVSRMWDHLHSFMSIVYSDGLGQFQDGNATLYASRVATKWLHEHSSGFRHLHWHSKFPDMNIIEHTWDALQCANHKRSPIPGTLRDLWNSLQDSLCELLQDAFKHSSTPCHAVLRNCRVFKVALHDI